MRTKFFKAFTLTELLVVIVVVGIIVSGVTFAVNSSRVAARDTSRVNEVKALQEALELYKNTERSYPSVITAGSPLVGPISGLTFLQSVPSDPSPTDGSCNGAGYVYTATTTGYIITYCLGQGTAQITAGTHYAKAKGIDVAFCDTDADCTSPQTCSNGTCYSCTPNCTGKCAGESDGCGGTCTCSGNLVCNSGTCCTPSCTTKGADSGCGFTCSSNVLVTSGDNGTAVSGVYDSANQKIVEFLLSNTSVKARVGTTSNGSVSYGTAVTVATGTPYQSTFDSTNGKVIAVYNAGANSNYGTAAVGTVSGTDISFGTGVAFNSTANAKLASAFDSTNGKVVVAYSTGSAGTAKVGTVSGTSISFGSNTNFIASNPDTLLATFDSSNGKVVIVYVVSGNVYAVVGTVSGTAISFGTPLTVSTEGFCYIRGAVFDSTNNKVVIVWRNWGYAYNRAAVGTVSDTSISTGTVTTIVSGTGVNHMGADFDSYSGKVIIAYGKSSNTGGAVVAGTVSGTSISFSSALTFQSSNTLQNALNVVYDGNTHKTVIFFTLDSPASIQSVVTTVLSGNMVFY